MKIKKLLASVLVATMVFGCTITAFAADDAPTASALTNADANTKGGYSTQVTGDATVETPVIKIVVPTTTSVVLNPYKIPITTTAVNTKLGLAADDVDKVIASALSNAKDEITAPTYTIYNLSNVKIKVVPTITVKATGVTMVETVPGSTDKNYTAKWANITAKFDGLDTNDADVVLGKTYKDTIPSFIIDAASSTKAVGDDGKITYTYAGEKTATLTFTGDLCDPANVATAWNETDKLALTIKYDFAPQVME